MKQQIDDETIEFNIEILEKLKKEGFNLMICTPLNIDSLLNSIDNNSNFAILFTPIYDILEGFRLLKNLNKESFLLTFDEVEEELYLTKEPYLEFSINKNHLKTLP